MEREMWGYVVTMTPRGPQVSSTVDAVDSYAALLPRSVGADAQYLVVVRGATEVHRVDGDVEFLNSECEETPLLLGEGSEVEVTNDLGGWVLKVQGGRLET